jgi:hypothetical protein
MQRLIFVLILAACACLSLRAEEGGGDLREQIFSVTRIGFAGTYTGGYLAVWAQRSQPDAEAIFLAQLKDPDPAARLYGLVGLKLIASDQYAVSRDALAREAGKVAAGPGGCMIMSMPIKDLVALIDRTGLEDPGKDSPESPAP